jgi:hypothetical protein
MRSLVKTTVLCGMYLAVLLGLGLWHHHDPAGTLAPHSNCQACAWQANAVSDEPLIFEMVVRQPDFTLLTEAPIESVCRRLDLLPASRAPPPA